MNAEFHAELERAAEIHRHRSTESGTRAGESIDVDHVQPGDGFAGRVGKLEYRLGDAEELEYLGYRDYLNPETLCLIEWPQRAAGYLNAVDLAIELDYDAAGRRLVLVAGSEWGARLIARLSEVESG